MGASDFRFETVDALLASERSGNGRHFRIVAIVADAHRDAAVEINTLDVLEKAMHEVLARLLSVGDDVDTRVFLLFERQQGRIALCLDKRLTLELPGSPQYSRLGQPSRLRQTAGDRCLEHAVLLSRAWYVAVTEDGCTTSHRHRVGVVKPQSDGPADNPVSAWGAFSSTHTSRPPTNTQCPLILVRSGTHRVSSEQQAEEKARHESRSVCQYAVPGGLQPRRTGPRVGRAGAHGA